ncbi:MAG: GntR family transcriptional regulator [Aestuariivita sp.]|nr:GntR family transcriptional regulator [Aestuariivita sp.]
MDVHDRISAAEHAYLQIRIRILSGELEAGTRLKEHVLAEELGISRTPVRSAITRLIHEGFVKRGEGYSTRVASFPDQELDQIFEIRRRLECYAASQAALLASEQQIQHLDELTTRMEQLTPPTSANETQELAAINTEFHRIIAEAASSPRLMTVLQIAVDVGIVTRTFQVYSAADRIRSARHHRELVDAIKARSPRWAESVMSSHILAAAQLAKKQV